MLASPRRTRPTLALTLLWALASDALPAPAVNTSATPLSCLDETGRAVDWWFMIKHPRYEDKSKKVCDGNCEGNTYVYVTSAQPDAWLVGGAPVSSATGSLLGQQSAGIYDGSVKNYVMYNDQLPDGSYSTTFGHSKGWFAYDATSAYFVQHSIPKFPNYKADGYEYGTGQMWYGQHAFCMSLTPKALDQIASVMRYANPQVYDRLISDPSLDNVNKVVAEDKSPGTVSTTVDVGWAELTLVGKASAADEDMLDLLVAPLLSETMLSQSWLNSGGPIGGYCPKSGYDVFDILQLKLPPDDTHVTYEDHSKWAVSKAPTSKWWCALDNNHVASQETRSGLAVCSQTAVSRLLRSAVGEEGKCGAPSPPGPTPGSCCYYHDATCTKGQICCASSGKSYASESTCDKYGAEHHCVWEADTSVCDIPK